MSKITRREENVLEHESRTGRGVCRKEVGKVGLLDGGWPWMPTESVQVFDGVIDIINDKTKVTCQGI